MKKFYLAFFLVFVVLLADAQKKFVPLPANPSAKFTNVKRGKPLTISPNFQASGCSAVDLPVPDSWGGTVAYVFDAAPPIDTGWVTGTSLYSFPAVAQYFDESSTTNNYIDAAFVGFGDAYSTLDSLPVPVNIYDGTSGKPGAIIGTTTLYMAGIESDVNNNYYSQARFNPAIAMPASKKFFVGVDLSNLDFYANPADSLAVYSSHQGAAGNGWVNYYSSKTKTTWASYTTLFGAGNGLALDIHPFISETAGCDLLPVNLVSFSAVAKGKDALLNWQVAQESNMKQYVIEKAGINQQFVPVGTVAATNTAVKHSYTFTDVNALNSGELLYYRLKQVDKDGKTGYSRVITLSPSAGETGIKVVNPFKNAVQLQVNSPYAQKLQGGIYDMLGRKVANAPDQVLSAGQNTVTIPAASLPKGMYILNVTVGKTTYKYKILN